MADFFDKVITGIGKGMNSAKENSKLIVEKTRLIANIKTTEDIRAKFFQQLGTIAYNMQCEGVIAIDDFAKLCNDITQCSQDINNYKNELKTLDISQPQAVSNSNEPSLYGEICSCGFVNKANSKFCAACGSKLDNTDVQNNE